MAVYQTNLFICELCGHTQSVSEQTSVYSDPVVTYPPGWGDDGTSDCRDCCPICLINVTHGLVVPPVLAKPSGNFEKD